MQNRFEKAVEAILNKNYELVGKDVSTASGNNILLFKSDGKIYAVEVYEWNSD